jgi:hypothetical protein
VHGKSAERSAHGAAPNGQLRAARPGLYDLHASTSWKSGRYTMLQVSARHPVTVGVRLGYDDGMAVDAVTIIVQPYAYQGGDGNPAGTVWHVTRRDLRPEGQTITATFTGLDDAGSRLPKGVYKMLVDLESHRTSSSTCVRVGPVDEALSNQSQTQVTYGLVSIDQAKRPHGA